MITSTTRLQSSVDVGVGSSLARAGVARRVPVLAVLVCVMLGALLHQSLGSGGRVSASVAGSHVESQAGLLSLPLAAQGPVSSALGRDQAAYRINGLLARNPAQRLSAQFGRSGVSITTGSTRFAISLKGFGRGQTLRALPPVSPTASANRVSYARGSVGKWAAGVGAGF
jgi:hypothetical protein